jgi:mannose-1-phosphate guanylyltransferase/mannose-6-phosphate isomerase
MKIQPVVLSGGSGTRLWPLSREKYPKQLMALVGNDSLLQATVRRVEGLAGVTITAPMVVCNEEYRFVIAEQLRQMGQSGNIVLEPLGRNTAPALTLAALATIKNEADAVLLVMPADHVILDTKAFHAAVHQGATLAFAGAVVTFGITPEAPETGYGYIQSGETFQGAKRIVRFVEKPDVATAQSYLDAGTYLWNSGIFMMKASVWMQAMAACRADIFTTCQKAWDEGKVDGEFMRVGKDTFAQCPSDSIDYAVMERLAAGVGTPGNTSLPPGMVIPLSAGWSDVGAWDALWQVLPKDETGNVARGDVMLQDCSNTLAVSCSRLITCVGVSDLIVVETADAILVAHKDNTQDVKKIVDSLKKSGRTEGSTHRKVFRPWGWYDGVDAGERFQVKRIVVKPQGILSLQMHHHRAEHWIVVSGTAKVTRGENTYLVSENESTFIPLGTTHRLENPGRVPLEMIEVQSGSYLGEDDIVRFEDMYGR